jgi:hypothetical protein
VEYVREVKREGKQRRRSDFYSLIASLRDARTIKRQEIEQRSHLWFVIGCAPGAEASAGASLSVFVSDAY